MMLSKTFVAAVWQLWYSGSYVTAERPLSSVGECDQREVLNKIEWVTPG